MVYPVWGFLIWSHKPVKLFTDFSQVDIYVHFSGDMVQGFHLIHSYLNPKVIDSISAWNPYTMTEANKLRDTGFFQIQLWLWNNGPAPLLAATWRWALLVACWVNATLCLQNNVALSEWSITWKPGWVPDLLQYCHILMRCCNLTLKPTGRESGDSLHFPWICPFRFQRNPSQVPVSCWQCLGRNS